MTTTISRFEARLAPCGRSHEGERCYSEDLQGLMTEELRFACGCRSAKEEFHDGSVHLRVVHHRGRVLVDQEFRGE
jgi:hypothetical protein